MSIAEDDTRTANHAIGVARAESERSLQGIRALDRAGAVPLSFAQERLWFLNQLEPGSTVYNVPIALRMEGALDVAALERAFGEIVRRHDTLRTTFVRAGDAPVQIVAPFTGFTLPVEDLSGLAVAEQEAEVQRRGRENA